MPNAKSKQKEPVEIASTCIAWFCPRRITAPFPNCFSICAIAVSSAFALSNAMVSFLRVFLHSNPNIPLGQYPYYKKIP